MKKPEAYIDNWAYNGAFLIGTISKHPNQTSFKLNFQMTSAVVRFEESAKIAETEHTIYHLLHKMQ
jgi:hypothetical protein